MQADVRAILVAAGECFNAEENLSRVAFTSNQPEVPEPPLNRSLGQVASAGIYGGMLESCD